MIRTLLAVAFTVLGLVAVPSARGHAVGESYVWVNVDRDRLAGRFEIPFSDLREKLGLDVPRDIDAARDFVAATAGGVHRYIREQFSIFAGEREVPLLFTRSDVLELEMGNLAQYYYETGTFEVPDTLRVRNNLLFENDRFHRSLLAIAHNRKTGEEYGDEFAAMIFSASDNDQLLDLLNVRQILRPRDFVWQGMLHIWIGIDHILFLLILLLPAVLVRVDGRWIPVANFRQAFWNVLKIVTIFTVAHSITLTLAALEIIRFPSRLVESVIALSIILVGVNVIFPKFREGYWLVIFVFGLFHGLGFASVMGHLQFRLSDLLKVMLAFNAGVEIGQMAIVACVFPVIFWLRNNKVYLPFVLRGGSIAICLVASYWFVERAFGL